MKLLVLLFTVLLFTSGCKQSATKPTETFPLKITFVNKVGTQTMQLGNTYQNAFGEAYTLNNFKYYISNIALLHSNGNEAKISDQYFLVDEANASTKSFTINVPGNHFTGFTFYIGVDSARNVSGTQTGDLDPAKGMFWTWNNGYIMAKLDGTSPVSTAPAHSLSLHVGGFRMGENTVRKINPALPAGSTLHLNKDRVTEIIIEANAATWFKGDHDLPIANFPLCHNPGQLAVRFADNYSKMFKVIAVNN